MSVSKLPDDATFRRGILPDTAVNIAYLATKDITPDSVVVQNVAGSSVSKINNTIDGLYFAGYNGKLEGGPKVTDVNLYVTDKYHNGVLSKPLYFIAKSRYYHMDSPIYTSGERYTNNNITITNLDGTTYSGNYEIYVEPHEDYIDVDGLPTPYDLSSPTELLNEIPYRIIVYIDTDAPLKISYNKASIIDSPAGLGVTDTSYSETLNSYPYFEESDLSTVAAAMVDENIYHVDSYNDEYQVTVPAEIISDDRKFQYFYWRIKGYLGSADIPTPTSNPTPDSSPTIPGADDDLNDGTLPEPTQQSGVFNLDSYTNFIPKVINIGIYDIGQGYPSIYQPMLSQLEMSVFNVLGVELKNPYRDDHSRASKDYGIYWHVTKSDIEDGAIDSLDILIVPVVYGEFEFDKEIDDWSKKNGKGVIFVFDHLPFYTGSQAIAANLATEWGVRWDSSITCDTVMSYVESHDLCTGRRSVHNIANSPVLEEVLNPFGDTSPIETWFGSCYGIKYDDSDKFATLIGAYSDGSPSSPDHENAISGVYDDRLIVLDPFSAISVLGAARTNDGVLVNYNTSSCGKPSFYGLYTGNSSDFFKIRMTYRQDAMKFLYNCIVYLAGGENMSPLPEQSATNEYNDNPPNEVPSIVIPPTDLAWSGFSTPYIRSWITTKDSLSTQEIQDDSELLIKDGKLMRNLTDVPIDEILKSFIAQEHGIDYLTMGDAYAEIEITNPNVTLYEEGDNTYAYTNTYGGLPFEPGKAYPSNWIRSDHWASTKKLVSDDLEFNLLGSATRYWNEEYQVPTTVIDTTTVPVTKVGTRPVDVAPTYNTHSPSWNVSVTSGSGASQTVNWNASGTYVTTSGGVDSSTTEEKVIVSGNVSFTTKSKELETNRSTAYAWVYLPQCEKCWANGSSGSEISFWQTALKNLGYYTGSIDGQFGPLTKSAVLSFQSDHNEILEDSIIGPETGGRIAQACSDAGKFVPNHYTYVSTNNLLETSSGSYGRRTNPWNVVYKTSSLQDYIKITFTSPVSISRLELKGYGGPSGHSFKVTRVTTYTSGGTKLSDISPGQTISPGSVSSISLGSQIDNIGIIYIHVDSSSSYFSEDANAYYWGLQYIQGYKTVTTTTDTTNTSTETYTTSGSVSLTPGFSKNINLPSTTGGGNTITWNSGSVTVGGSATVVAVGGTDYRTWTITDTRASSNTYTGSTDSCTITVQDGVKTFNALLPSEAASDMTAILQASTDGYTMVQFYDGYSFVGTSTSVSNLTGSNAYKIGVKATDQASGGGTIYEEYTYTDYETVSTSRTVYVTHVKTLSEKYVTTTGTIELDGEDPPVGYFAYKPYSIRQYDGRLNIKVFPPQIGLTSIDAWCPSITFGKFSRSIDISGSAVGWQAMYPESTVVAHYSIPDGVWSEYGDYTIEYADEELSYYGPHEVLTKHFPLLFNEDLDGVTDISISINGTPVTDDEITNISKDGLIELSQTISSSDVITGTYYTRSVSKDIVGLNMNPYPGHLLEVDGNTFYTYQKIGLPVYIYILPGYCTLDGEIISDSYEGVVINYTINSEIFDPSSSYYNPLAILVAIVSCSSTVTPDDITLLDARKRGGGAEGTENTSFFDVDYFTDKAYPENGFVIFNIFSGFRDQQDLIDEAIKKNIAAGTLYKIRWINYSEITLPESQSTSSSMLTPSIRIEE